MLSGEMTAFARRAAVGIDTVVARAFRKALGLPVEYRGGGVPSRVSADRGRYEGMAECFANERRVLV